MLSKRILRSTGYTLASHSRGSGFKSQTTYLTGYPHWGILMHRVPHNINLEKWHFRQSMLLKRILRSTGYTLASYSRGAGFKSQTTYLTGYPHWGILMHQVPHNINLGKWHFRQSMLLKRILRSTGYTLASYL